MVNAPYAAMGAPLAHVDVINKLLRLLLVAEPLTGNQLVAEFGPTAQGPTTHKASGNAWPADTLSFIQNMEARLGELEPAGGWPEVADETYPTLAEAPAAISA